MKDCKRKTGIKTGWWLITILSLLPLLTACSIEAQPPKPPLNLPFAVQNAGSKVETELRIIERHLYSFTLRFLYRENDQVDRARVRKLTGGYEIDKTGKLTDPGVPVLLKLTIYRQGPHGQHQFFAKEISEQPLYSWGGDSLNKKIADIFLETGDYTIIIESLKDIPELEGTRINFVIVATYQGK